MEITFIYFDLGNVLLNFNHDKACQQMGEVAGVSAMQVKELLFNSGLQWKYERGELTTLEVYEQFTEATQTEPNYQELIHAAADIFEPNQPVLNMVSGLSKAGYALGIISNTCAAHWEFVSQGAYPELNLFQTLILSYQEKLVKPDTEIYELAIQRAGVSAEQILFLDDLKENVAGATEAGIQAHLYESPEQLLGTLLGAWYCLTVIVEQIC